MPEVFLSFRFAEALDEAKKLKLELERHGLQVFLCDTIPGSDLQAVISEALVNSKLLVLLATETYGRKTNELFSTLQEMNYALERGNPFVIKMCDDWVEPATLLALGSRTMYTIWKPGTEIPSGLVGSIKDSVSGVASTNSVQRSPSPCAKLVTFSDGCGPNYRCITDQGTLRTSTYDLKIVSEISRGMFGPVLLCHSSGSSSHPMAVKKCFKTNVAKKIRWSHGGEAFDDISQELKVLRSTNHDYVIKLINTMEDDEAVYLVMEWGGHSVADIMEQTLTLEGGGRQKLYDAISFMPHERRIIVKQVVEAVLHIHSHGICHLDLCPENIVARYNRSGDICTKIIDFGCSKYLEKDGSGMFAAPRPLQVENLLGKLSFVCPEMLRYDQDNAKIDGMAADCWSLGKIMIIILVPQAAPLWSCPNESDMYFRALCDGGLQSLVPSLHGLNPATWSLALRLLSIDPILRPSSHALFSHVTKADWFDAKDSIVTTNVKADCAPSIVELLECLLHNIENISACDTSRIQSTAEDKGLRDMKVEHYAHFLRKLFIDIVCACSEETLKGRLMCFMLERSGSGGTTFDILIDETEVGTLDDTNCDELLIGSRKNYEVCLNIYEEAKRANNAQIEAFQNQLKRIKWSEERLDIEQARRAWKRSCLVS